MSIHLWPWPKPAPDWGEIKMRLSALERSVLANTAAQSTVSFKVESLHHSVSDLVKLAKRIDGKVDRIVATLLEQVTTLADDLVICSQALVALQQADAGNVAALAAANKALEDLKATVGDLTSPELQQKMADAVAAFEEAIANAGDTEPPLSSRKHR